MKTLYKSILFSGFIGISLILVYFLGQFAFAQTLSVKERKAEMNKDSEILLKLSDDNLKLYHQDEFVKVIEKVGNLKIEQAVPRLIDLIDYRVADEWENSPFGFRLNSKSTEYPAVGALIQIGNPSVSELVELIENEEIDSTKSQNALYAIQQIYLSDLYKCTLLLEEASTKSKNPNGSKRLQIAADKTREMWKNFQNIKVKNQE